MNRQKYVFVSMYRYKSACLWLGVCRCVSI